MLGDSARLVSSGVFLLMNCGSRLVLETSGGLRVYLTGWKTVFGCVHEAAFPVPQIYLCLIVDWIWL